MPQAPTQPGAKARDHARLPENQLRFSKLLREINRKLADGHDYSKILDFLFDSLDVFIPYDRISIALVEGEGTQRQVCSKWMKSKIHSSNIGPGYCAPLAGSSLETILETGSPRIINDLVQYGLDHPGSESTKLILKDGIRSSLTCPLRANIKFIGIVFFSSNNAQTYNGEHVETYLEIADELSLILAHSQLRRNALSGVQNLRMILHDLRAPLGVIQGYLDLASEMDWFESLDVDAKKLFSILDRNSSYMLELLNELGELNRLSHQGEKIDLREVTLHGFVAELATRGRELAEKKDIGFAVLTTPGLPEKARLDMTKIRRVLDNLITNAVKYSARGTKIQLSIKRDHERLVFEVTDEGQGIPQSELPKLFREFGKTTVCPTEGEQSTGLGLAIAKKIVEQHGGEISIKSEVDKGSTFTFWLPLDEKAIIE